MKPSNCSTLPARGETEAHFGFCLWASISCVRTQDLKGELSTVPTCRLDPPLEFDDNSLMSLKTVSLNQLESMVRSYLAEKKQAKPTFSIRNQAARWDIAHSTLQKVVSGERQLGLRTAQKLAAVFNTRLQDDKRPRRRPEERWNFGLLDANSSEQVSWLNLAILELLKLEDFTPSADWVAQRMGLDVEVTEFILQKMEREKMLKRDGDRWTDLLEDSVVAL